MENNSLDRWLFEIRANNKVWKAFFEKYIGRRLSSYPKLMKLVDMYGDVIVLQAIADTSGRTLDARDPLNYISTVASAKWKSEQQQKDAEKQYNESIELAKKITREKNQDLARLIKERK
jgi:hypothetical protein